MKALRTSPIRALALVAAAGVAAAGCAVVPGYDASTSTFEGFPVVSFVPDHATGIVFAFHGTGGSADFATKIETVDMLNHLAARGYGFVSTDSTDRTTKQWDTASLSLTDNPDLARLSRLYANLVAGGRITSTTPVFAIGMSRGAAFASVFAQAFRDAGYPVAALAPSHGPIPPSVRLGGGLTVPALFALGANDQVVDNARIEGQVAELAQRGVPAPLFVEPETPLAASRFLRVPGIDTTEAGAIFTALVRAGLWDPAGHRTATIDAVEHALPTVPLPSSITAGQRLMVRDEVDVVLAVHQYSATYASQTVAFFDAHR
jgi:dienelactone hydrolase